MDHMDTHNSVPVDGMAVSDQHEESSFSHPLTVTGDAGVSAGNVCECRAPFSTTESSVAAESSSTNSVVAESSSTNSYLKTEVDVDDQAIDNSAFRDDGQMNLTPEQERINEVDLQLPKSRPKKGGRKGRIKRRRNERSSRQKSASDVQMATDFTFMRKRRQDLTLGAKVKVLEMLDHEPKVPQGKIASVFRVSQSQISRIMKNKEAILAQWNQYATPERKRCRVGKAGALEQKLLDWYKEARKEELPISGPILMEKAKSIGVEMGIEFKPSAGWLGRWKDRNGVTLKIFKEKDGSSSITKVANHWRRYMFAKAIRDVPWQNVWVVDETVLAYNSVPDFMENQRIFSGKERMCVILACNLSGTERRPAAVVGPVQSLESLSLPLSYYYHTKAKITLDCFSSWLRDWDKELQIQKKKIVLILNKSKYHPENIHFFNISVTHFPVDTAKVLHPLQLGIVSSFKALYRHQQLKLLLSKAQANEHISHSNICGHNPMLSSLHFEGVSTIDAVYMIYKAWKHVSPETIVKGAVKAGLSKDVDALKVDDYVSAPPGITQQDFRAFVMADNDLSVENLEETEKSEACDKTPVYPSNYSNLSTAHCHQIQRNNSQVEHGSQYIPALPKVPEAVFACQVLRQYLQQQGGRLYDEFSKLESAIQMDMICESQSDIKDESKIDPFHDSISVHSLHAHKQAESLKIGYLQKLHSAMEQKCLQKELKKAAQVPNSSTMSGTTDISMPVQEVIRSDATIQAACDAERHSLSSQELSRQDIRQGIQPTIQRPPLIHQEMIRPEYRQDMCIDRSRSSLFEMRSVDMSSVYRPVQPGTRSSQSENKNGTMSSLPANLRTVPISDPRGGATVHHPGHELPQNIRQPDTRLEHPGIPYYAIPNPLHHCVCGNTECCS